MYSEPLIKMRKLPTYGVINAIAFPNLWIDNGFFNVKQFEKK